MYSSANLTTQKANYKDTVSKEKKQNTNQGHLCNNINKDIEW